ncbi:hypothetical protein B4589_008990 [Halolamina sp. CBA1230]|uniref:hypothetical protein n=1 Tax=Halolamina sp. CBA1230 TaxID=1853690 RepID=UPI0009A181D4|nr:hypothetical protein [Halolamina sp. CBA1230]QKY20506.1 hypothetical protein B4589_008990 [Halolamina sp. CBA1230]
MGARVIRNFTNTFDGHVERQTIIKTGDPASPSGYKYSLHFGTLDGETVLRYVDILLRLKPEESRELGY